MSCLTFILQIGLETHFMLPLAEQVTHHLQVNSNLIVPEVIHINYSCDYDRIIFHFLPPGCSRTSCLYACQSCSLGFQLCFMCEWGIDIFWISIIFRAQNSCLPMAKCHYKFKEWRPKKNNIELLNQIIKWQGKICLACKKEKLWQDKVFSILSLDIFVKFIRCCCVPWQQIHLHSWPGFIHKFCIPLKMC